MVGDAPHSVGVWIAVIFLLAPVLGRQKTIWSLWCLERIRNPDGMAFAIVVHPLPLESALSFDVNGSIDPFQSFVGLLSRG